MSAATELTNQIIDFVYRRGGYAWRASSVGVYDSKMQSFRTAAKKGVSDVLAVHKSWLIAVEIKIGTDRLSDEQEGFMRNVNHAGGVTMVAKDFEDFKKQWTTYLTSRSEGRGEQFQREWNLSTVDGL